MLSNAYLLANFRFDTAENEPATNLKHLAKIAILLNANLQILLTREPVLDGRPAEGAELHACRVPGAEPGVAAGKQHLKTRMKTY